MAAKSAQQVVLKVLAILMIVGGAVRLLANQGTFQSFMIDNLWVSHPYFVYIYRVLGAFVVLAGVILYMIGRDPVRYASMLQAVAFCFSLIGVVMVIAGYALKMAFMHYAFDFFFSFLVSVVCFSLSVRRVRN